ncbi:MAG TPA: dihydroorotate dehydrogenase [Planctomycetota bacterium]|nr:dihydroorotate dehydrogenase B catalytic subunit [Planctomycetota bacterium]MDP6128604.1 dihydroorotate dehydrogenase [Planctomycetota bacterium]HJM39726.1 dihydroorotate dehydrogenase [Planctomycetota bacterium]|tara:strand:- start:4143 stop:5066 length:924 start_codon:yes stop_codon:yes gene_type:complete
MNRLKTQLGSLELQSPLMTASGTFGQDGSALQFLSQRELGAIVLKTVTPQPRHGNPPPRLFETPSGLLNSIGLENQGVEAFLNEVVPELGSEGIPIVANVGGESVDEFCQMVEAFGDLDCFQALELNLSCPNVGGGRLPFSTCEKAVHEVLDACRSLTKKPLWAKLSPNVTRIAPMAIAAEKAGADALTVGNTVLGLAVNWRTRKPELGVGYGGFSGPAIRPIAMRMVWETSQAVDIPVIGCGGISSAEDVLSFLVAGASSVQLGTAFFRNPSLFGEVSRQLTLLLEQEGASVSELSRSLEWPSSCS